MSSCEIIDLSTFSQELNHICDGPKINVLSSVEIELIVTDKELNKV